MDLKLQCASESPWGLVKPQTAGPHPQSFWFSRSEVGLRIHISNKLMLMLQFQESYFDNHCFTPTNIGTSWWCAINHVCHYTYHSVLYSSSKWFWGKSDHQNLCQHTGAHPSAEHYPPQRETDIGLTTIAQDQLFMTQDSRIRLAYCPCGWSMVIRVSLQLLCDQVSEQCSKPQNSVLTSGLSQRNPGHTVQA